MAPENSDLMRKQSRRYYTQTLSDIISNERGFFQKIFVSEKLHDVLKNSDVIRQIGEDYFFEYQRNLFFIPITKRVPVKRDSDGIVEEGHVRVEKLSLLLESEKTNHVVYCS